MQEIKTKGNVFVNNIKLNDILYEKKAGLVIKSHVINIPKLDVKNGIITWKCRDDNDEIIDYHIHPDFPQYHPIIYDYEIE